MRLPQIGEIFISRYVVHGVLGEGGSGAVYDAEDTVEPRRVALKVLKPDAQDGSYDPRTRARFEREVAAAAALTCRHTVRMYESGETPDGLLFIAFERVEGEDLRAVLSRVGRLPAGAVRHVLNQLLQSLEEAHRAGLLHRDIKPENVRVFEQSGDPLYVKLLDFGLARPASSESPSITKTGELLGTPRYMSPEQLINKPLTPASDLYSVGIMTYELLLGADALQGNRWEDQVERLRAGHEFLVPEFADSDRQLTAVIEKMCARDVHRRFSSAAAVRAALSAIDTVETAVKGPPTVTIAPTTESEKPRSMLVAALVLVVAVAFAAGVAATLFITEPEVTPTPKVAERDNPLAPEPEPPHELEVVAVDLGAPEPAVDASTKPLDGCSQDVPFRGLGQLKGEWTDWLTYVPKSYEPGGPVPLVILLHNAITDADQLIIKGGFKELAESEGFIAIAPSYGGEMATRIWDERQLVLDIVNEARLGTQGALCIDTERVYVVGQGEGGRGATYLSCEDWVTAIATNCFRLLPEEDICSATTPKPHLMMSPLNCDLHPFDGEHVCFGAYEWPSATAVEERWLENNGCEASPPERTYDEDGSTCHHYSCDEPFETCHIKGGHQWPGTVRSSMLLGTCDGPPIVFDVLQRTWDFFKEH